MTTAGLTHATSSVLQQLLTDARRDRDSLRDRLEAMTRECNAWRRLAMGTIITVHEHPPTPIRSHDWRATRPDSDEHGPCGWGATEVQAVRDLLEQEDDHQ